MSTPIEDYVQQLELESWSAFKSKVDSFRLEWIYRGQAKASWNLASSLERSPSLRELDHEIEEKLIGEYRRAIRCFGDYSKEPRTTLEWLALLQHHGTPTRLIDFTHSPYVAAYFAFQEESRDDEEPVSIWCVNKIRFFQAAKYYLREKLGETNWPTTSYLYADEAFEDLFSHRDLNCVIPFQLTYADERQLMQQALFLVPMNPQKPFQDQLGFLDYQAKPIVTRLTIPRNDRRTALRDLIKMNITHATLFPGIDGFSRSLGLKYSTLATFGETGQWLVDLKEDGFVP